jgi:pimeloyl-ACP methyl ester carboxylesterase
MDVGYPGTRRTVSTPFGDVAYRDAGDGPPALFVHGVFLNADLWSRQLDGLADLRRCLAVDLLAHGASACSEPGRLTMALQAQMILAFLDALGLDSVDLVGNDSGGAIAQLVAVAAPTRIRTLTLTNCDTHDNWPPEAFRPVYDMATAGTLAPTLTALASDPTLARAALASGFENPDTLSDETIAAFFAPFAAPAGAKAVQGFVAAMDNAVTVDEFFDVAWARWLAATIPGTVRCRELEGARLFFPAERPEVLNAELRALWTDASPTAPARWRGRPSSAAAP